MGDIRLVLHANALNGETPDGCAATRGRRASSARCSFGGDALDTFHITSANCEMSEEERRRHPDDGGLFAMPAPVPRLTEPYVRLSD